MSEEIAISEASRKIIDREQSHHRSRSVANAEKWGVQDQETLALAISEQSGKLSQSILHSTHEPDKCVAGRTLDEARHLGALSIQVAFAYLVDKSLAEKPKRKPCPFCGSIHSTIGYFGDKRAVVCDVCGAQGTMATLEYAVEFWNNREGE